MSTLKIKKGSLIPEVYLPSSKSYANRALILAALTKQSKTLVNLPSSTDVSILVECLEKIGLIIEKKENTLMVKNDFPSCEGVGSILHVGEGGTTARFLAALLLLGKAPYELILGERLSERPWGELLKFVNQHGGKAELRGRSLLIQGPLRLSSSIQIDCSKTTQFASSFQMSLSNLGIKVNPVNMGSSQSYWNMTEKLIETLKKNDTYEIPLDWSSASYPLAFGALNHEINFPGLFHDPYQADSKFMKILQDFGAIEIDRRGIKVKKMISGSTLKLDVSDCLDLVPTLGFFLSHLPGVHELSGISNLIYKESDRLQGVIDLLQTFGKKTFIKDERLYIEGNTHRISQPVTLKLPNDHRMVMVGSLFLIHHGGGEISPVDAVNKSYPDFFSLLKR